MNGKFDDPAFEFNNKKGSIRSQNPQMPKRQNTPNAPKKQKDRTVGGIIKKSLLVLGISVLGLFIGSGVGIAYYMGFIPNLGSGIESFSYDADTGEQLSNRVTFLLVGVDQREGQSWYNADSIILASADPDTKIISLMSIPRDSEVMGHTKLNAIPSMRGMETTMKVVSEITGIKIDGYIKTNFNGFKEIIDILGGIDIYVEKDMYKLTGDEEDGVINLKKGMQRLDGSQALQFARFRSDPLGDITRTGRQQKVIMAMAKEALKPGTIVKLPQLLPQVLKSVETNLKTSELLRLAGMAKNFKSDNMVSATAPGYFLSDADNISFWRIDAEAVKRVAANLLKGISTNLVVMGGINEVPFLEGDDDPLEPPDPDTPEPPEPPGPDDPTLDEIMIRDYVGENYIEVEAELKLLGLRVTSSSKVSEDIPEGAVISTRPAANTKVAKNSSVTITYSAGPGPLP
ncbi:MAG: LCP family protein [Peptococcaceae bacterium]|nr:LCP family protein [Peptococcaceae bacterium]